MACSDAVTSKPTHVLRLLRPLLFVLAATLAVYLLLFAAGRTVFLLVNSMRAVDLEPGLAAQGLLHGLPFDISVWAYVAAATCALLALTALARRPRLGLALGGALAALAAIVCAAALPADALVYRAWGHHPTASDLLMFRGGTQAIWDSIDAQALTLYIIGVAILALFFAVVLFKVVVRARHLAPASGEGPYAMALLPALAAALLVIPIRGGLGIVPLNTGRAYFCSSVFANHVAVNPVWNFLYSTKRATQADLEYPFLPPDEARQRFDSLMVAPDRRAPLLSEHRPNMVVILLESFAAHGVEYLGGAPATPNLDRLRRQGVGFSNFFAASDRSGKGLVATLCGYPSLPTVSPIQFPQKTQTLASLPRMLREAGYASQAFVYGGDLNFNNFNSLVRQCGFDRVVTADDFDAALKGEKWGAHDQHTFERLLHVIDRQTEPFFDFFFTLSSHEPFDVPYHKLADPYLNSMAYTDSCLGAFVDSALLRPWARRTLFVLLADHGTPGPDQVDETDRRKFNIPLVLFGPALAAADSTVHTYCSQVDLPTMLARQVGLRRPLSPFSRDALAVDDGGHAFFDFNDGFGFATPGNYLVRDNAARRWMRLDRANADTLDAMAYLQVLADDFRGRGVMTLRP